MSFSAFEAAHLLAVLPELLLVALGALVMGLDLAWPEGRKRALGLTAAGGLGVILAATLVFSRPSGVGEPLIFGGTLRNDFAAFFFRVMFIFSGLIVSLLAVDSQGVERRGDFYTMVIAAVFGMNFMAYAADLIMLYLAIETTSIAGYLLAGYLHHDDKSAESGVKYFLFGAFTSTVMLYGFSLLYGFTGQTNLYAVGQALASGAVPSGAAVMAVLLILAGLGFKVAAVPFHFWTPDVYEGAPTPVTAFISVASKAAGFAALTRVMLGVFPELQGYWQPLVAVVATFTMTVGNTIALAQRNIKRLLAYSSIAQAGYALVGLASVSEAGIAAVVFYLATYTVTNLAAFGVVIVTSRVIESDEISGYAGLSRRAPGLALALLIALLSLGGMPPLAGFFGKFLVFAAAVQADLVWLAVVGVLNAIVGLYYYLTVLKVVYLYRSEKDDEKIATPRAYAVALAVCAIGILLLGTWAGPWIEWATAAARTLF
jgi:NADH-quinone oxidoreductase subunit N